MQNNDIELLWMFQFHKNLILRENLPAKGGQKLLDLVFNWLANPLRIFLCQKVFFFLIVIGGSQKPWDYHWGIERPHKLIYKLQINDHN